MIAISTCLVVVPAANETLPAFATKSLPAVAVPLAVANRRLTTVLAGCESRRVTAAFFVPSSPSMIVTSSIEIDGGVTAIIDRGSSDSAARLASVGRSRRALPLRDALRRRNSSTMAWDVWVKNQLRDVMGHLWGELAVVGRENVRVDSMRD